MIHRVIDFGFELLARFWPLALGVCVLAFIIVVMIMVKVVRRKEESAESRQADRETMMPTVLHSLRRLPKSKYHCFQEVFVPRLSGEGTTKMQYVILSRYGIFVLQVQHESGKITGNPEDRDWCASQRDKKKIFINPIQRNAYHVKALAKHLNLPNDLFHSLIFFEAVVSFTDKTHPQIYTEGFGRAILSHATELISPELLERVGLILSEVGADSETGHETKRRAHEKSAQKRRTKTKSSGQVKV